MNIKKATNSQLSTESKKQKQLSEQPEQEQNHRYGGHGSINGRNKIDKGNLRIAWEKEKPKNSQGHELRGGLLKGTGWSGAKEEKLGQL